MRGTTVYSSRYSTTSLFANPVNSSTCPGPNCQQEIGTAYDINGVNTGNLPSGFAKAATGNPNLKWETSKQLNLGFDFSMFDNSFDGSFDIFRKRTSDILTTTVPLSTSGEGAQQVVNGGTVDNRGWEFEMGYRHSFSLPYVKYPLKMHFSGNVSARREQSHRSAAQCGERLSRQWLHGDRSRALDQQSVRLYVVWNIPECRDSRCREPAGRLRRRTADLPHEP